MKLFLLTVGVLHECGSPQKFPSPLGNYTTVVFRSERTWNQIKIRNKYDAAFSILKYYKYNQKHFEGSFL